MQEFGELDTSLSSRSGEVRRRKEGGGGGGGGGGVGSGRAMGPISEESKSQDSGDSAKNNKENNPKQLTFVKDNRKTMANGNEFGKFLDIWEKNPATESPPGQVKGQLSSEPGSLRDSPHANSDAATGNKSVRNVARPKPVSKRDVVQIDDRMSQAGSKMFIRKDKD